MVLVVLFGLNGVCKVGKVYKENRGLTLNTMIKLPLFWYCEKLLHLKKLGTVSGI